MTAIVCLALSAAALVIAVLSATRSRYRRAVRWLAVALVPTGLYLTGLMTMFARIGHAIADWAADLVFDPRVWTGVVMLGAALVLALLTGIGRRRRAKAVDSAGTATAVPARSGGRSAGSAAGPGQLPAGNSAATAPKAGSGKKSADDDFSDIEEILKRRGL